MQNQLSGGRRLGQVREFLVFGVALIAAFMTLFSASISVHAYQISPDNNTGTITVSTSDAYNDSHPFNNNANGVIDIICTDTSTGTLTNTGTLNNGPEGTLNNNSGGTLTNYSGGMLRNGPVGTLNNTGTLNNNSGGTLINGPDSMLNNNSGGTLNNYGGLNNLATLTNNSGGTLNNYGGLTTDFGSMLYNYGVLTNYSGGTLTNYHASTLTNYYGGTLNNTGTLNNNALGSLYGGTLNNYGGLNNYKLLNNYSAGTLNNNSGGTLNNADKLTNTGTLNNLGTIAGTGTYIQNAGQTINNGSLTQTLINIQCGSLSGTGTINGNVTIGSGAWVNPGNSPGTLTINGNYISSGNHFFEIAGLSPGQFDVLKINGNATFSGGKIEFNFINGFNASAGNQWDFLLADNISGWNTVSPEVNGLGAGLGYEIDAITGGERLLITQTQSVPLPSTILLLALGVVGVAGAKMGLKG